MDNMNSATISNTPPESPASDFQFLRREGIRHIQQLAGTSWTDHNIHDPGITILDQLCYALTDLSYRMDFDIRELLATETGNPYDSLFSPAEVLTVNPVTLHDYRKQILDVEGVKNAWIEIQAQSQPALFYYPDDRTLNLFEIAGKRSEQLALQGIYRVLVEKELAASTPTVLNAVAGRLLSCRNLCEDFDEIKILDIAPVSLSGMVEVGQVSDIDQLVAGILYRVARFISPRPRFYTLAEMMQKGKAVDEIFEGPALEHGFIDDDELNSHARKTALYTSDIVREIMDEPGVLYVSNIGINGNTATSAQNWFLTIEEGKTPVLDFEYNSGQNLQLVFTKNRVPLTIHPDRVKAIFRELKNNEEKQPLQAEYRNIILQEGMFRDLSTYYSIQNHFPQVYGIGEAGLPHTASPETRTKARQLKAYLLLFEQLLANYHAQLTNLNQLFSFSSRENRTYFYHSLVDTVPAAEEVFAGKKAAIDQHLSALVESAEDALQRKNRLLDHLLARFGETATKYALHLQSYHARQLDESGLYGAQKEAAASLKRQQVLQKLVNDKLDFLSGYPRFSNDRGRAFNYKLESWNTSNISGLEKRIAAKLGISNHTRRFLAGSNPEEEGFHLLEHILLRPMAADMPALDPYRITHEITGFEAAAGQHVKCISRGHGLQSGDRVVISKSEFYDGAYTTGAVLPNSFQIGAVYQKLVKKTIEEQGGRDLLDTTTPKGQWRRDLRDINTPVLTFVKPITGLRRKSDTDSTTVCEAPAHGLTEGDAIEITGTMNYNGTYFVSDITSDPLLPNMDAFEIRQAFTRQETTGRFVKINVNPDPYSMQFTCMFPGWIGRFKDAGFRIFVENTVREETPVHLTVYIRWLNKEEMWQFENTFSSFLSELKAKKDGTT